MKWGFHTDESRYPVVFWIPCLSTEWDKELNNKESKNGY
jgi:hypothetical protein